MPEGATTCGDDCNKKSPNKSARTPEHCQSSSMTTDQNVTVVVDRQSSRDSRSSFEPCQQPPPPLPHHQQQQQQQHLSGRSTMMTTSTDVDVVNVDNNDVITGVGTGNCTDDCFSRDELKVYKDEGDQLDDVNNSVENLSEEKFGLVVESEDEVRPSISYY